MANVRPNPQSRLKHVVCRPTVELSPSQRETGMHVTNVSEVASVYDVRENHQRHVSTTLIKGVSMNWRTGEGRD